MDDICYSGCKLFLPAEGERGYCGRDRRAVTLGRRCVYNSLLDSIKKTDVSFKLEGFCNLIRNPKKKINL